MPGYATPSPDTNQTAHRSSHEPDDAAKSAGGAGPCPKSGVAASFRSSATHDRSDSLDPDQSTRRYEKCGLARLVTAGRFAMVRVTVSSAIEFWPSSADGFWPTSGPSTYGRPD